MKITQPGPGVVDAYKNRNSKSKAVPKNSTSPGQDRAEISSLGRELQTYRARLREMPEVRRDRVEDLKARINNGTYKPDAGKIAEGMIREQKLDVRI